MKEAYGFIYIWKDKKRKMLYLGCHWGHEQDGYVCSSTRMRNAFRRRPNDFKRRIIKRIYTNRNDLIDEEHRLLQMIGDDELGNKYYNLTKHRNGHWSTNKDTAKTIGQKIALAHSRPETKRRHIESKLGDKNPMKNKEVSEKVRLKNIGKIPWNKGIKIGPNPEHSMRMKGRIPWNKGKILSKQ